MIRSESDGWVFESQWGGGIFGAIANPSGSLDVALNVAARESRLRRLAAAAGCPEGRDLRSMRQTHGATVARVRDGGDQGEPAECDALVAGEGSPILSAVTADCVPLCVMAPGGVAVVHAGWRGLANGIIEASLAFLRDASGSAPRDFLAFIGPAALGCCYEVGSEVLAAIGPSAVHDGAMLDSAATAAAQLRWLGVESIDSAAVCTICSLPSRLASFRRDGEAAGRQGTVAWSN